MGTEAETKTESQGELEAGGAMTKLLNHDVALADQISTWMIVTIVLVAVVFEVAWVLWRQRRDEINYRSDRIRANIWKPK